jgi:hypothetical protein
VETNIPRQTLQENISKKDSLLRFIYTTQQPASKLPLPLFLANFIPSI